jgi:hypothetical protein
VKFYGGAPQVAWKQPLKAEAIINAFVKSRHELTATHAAHERDQIRSFFYYQIRGVPTFDTGLLEEEASLPLVPKAEGGVRTKTIAPSQPREIYRIYRQKTLHGG